MGHNHTSGKRDLYYWTIIVSFLSGNLQAATVDLGLMAYGAIMASNLLEDPSKRFFVSSTVYFSQAVSARGIV